MGLKFSISAMSHDRLFNFSCDRKMNSSKLMWWAYLHQNGSIQLKRWFGDHKDYTSDCEGNDFVQRVLPPFEADTREEALTIATLKLNPN